MERYIAIKDNFFWKWSKKENVKYFSLMAFLLYDASYMDNSKLKRGCLEFVAMSYAKRIGITRQALWGKINYLKDKGEIRITEDGKRRILEVVYYDDYVIAPKGKERGEEETNCENSVSKKFTHSVKKINNQCQKNLQSVSKKLTLTPIYINTNNNNNNNIEQSENSVVDVEEGKEMVVQSEEDNKNEINLTRNKKEMEEYYKQFGGQPKNPKWETFTGTLPCGTQVYNCCGEYVRYIKTYVEKGYEETCDLFLRSFTKTGRAIKFCQRHKIPQEPVIEWLKEFMSGEFDKRQHELALKKDYKGTGEKFYNEINNHLINFLRKKVADREKIKRL